MALKQNVKRSSLKMNPVNKLAQAKLNNKPARVPIKSGLNKPNVTGSTAQQAATAPSVASTPAPSTPNTTNTAPTSQAAAMNYSSYNPASGQPDPRDAEYWSNLAKLQATAQQDFAGQQLEQSQADIEYNTNLSRAGEQRRRGVRDTAESLIGTGLLRSGSHNRRQNEDTIDYSNQLADWGREKSNDDTRRKAYMDSILANLGIEENALYAGATGRFAESQAEAAATQQALAEAAGSAPTGVTWKKSKKKARRMFA